jgi:D-alanyl-D-alanine carboxypeptidase
VSVILITNKLHAILAAQIRRGGVHNIVAAVQSLDRSLDFAGAAGIADPLTGSAMTTDTPYFIASVTKMYTAAVAMRLHQAGRLDLEAPLSRYLPDTLTHGIHLYKGVDYSQRILVRQLIDQSSGLPDHEVERPKGGVSLMDELKAGHDRTIDTAAALEIARRLKPHFPPGAPGKAYYSNLNYRLLGEIIETVTGGSMAANFAEHIFAPLGLQHTYLYNWQEPPAQPPATIYLKNAPVHVPKYLASNVSDGGLVSTVAESLRFLRAFFEGELFDRALLARMTQFNPMFFPLRYGYGLMHFQLPRYFSIRPLPEFTGHSGSTGSFAFFCPSRAGATNRPLFLAGTVNQIAPQKPFFLMISLVNALR